MAYHRNTRSRMQPPPQQASALPPHTPAQAWPRLQACSHAAVQAGPQGRRPGSGTGEAAQEQGTQGSHSSSSSSGMGIWAWCRLMPCTGSSSHRRRPRSCRCLRPRSHRKYTSRGHRVAAATRPSTGATGAAARRAQPPPQRTPRLPCPGPLQRPQALCLRAAAPLRTAAVRRAPAAEEAPRSAPQQRRLRQRRLEQPDLKLIWGMKRRSRRGASWSSQHGHEVVPCPFTRRGAWTRPAAAQSCSSPAPLRQVARPHRHAWPILAYPAAAGRVSCSLTRSSTCRLSWGSGSSPRCVNPRRRQQRSPQNHAAAWGWQAWLAGQQRRMRPSPSRSSWTGAAGQPAYCGALEAWPRRCVHVCVCVRVGVCICVRMCAHHVCAHAFAGTCMHSFLVLGVSERLCLWVTALCHGVCMTRACCSLGVASAPGSSPGACASMLVERPSASWPRRCYARHWPMLSSLRAERPEQVSLQYVRSIPHILNFAS